jgi:hypothetical protein
VSYRITTTAELWRQTADRLGMGILSRTIDLAIHGKQPQAKVVITVSEERYRVLFALLPRGKFCTVERVDEVQGGRWT